MGDFQEDKVRAELVAQLRESLAKSREMMLNEKLDAKTREQWTQANTNTAQVLNQVLRDLQFKDWERRLNEMETRKRKLQGTITKLEKATVVPTEGTTGQDPTGQGSVQGGS